MDVTGGSSKNPDMHIKSHPRYSNIIVAHTEFQKIFDGKILNSRRLMSENIIKNYDFKQGLDSWHPRSCRFFIAPSEGKADGGYAVVTDRTEWYSSLEQEITDKVSPGVTYSISAIVGVFGPFSGCSQIQATLRLEQQDATFEYQMVCKTHVPDGEWELLKGSFVLQSLPKRVFVYIEGPDPGQNLLIKSVIVCPLRRDISQTDENLIPNPGVVEDGEYVLC